MGINVGINAYKNAMSFRSGKFHNSTNQESGNAKNDNDIILHGTRNLNNREKAQIEGKTDNTTIIPQVNGLGRIMDFKI